MTPPKTLEQIERDRGFNQRWTRRYMGEIALVTHRAHSKEEAQKQEEEVRVKLSEDPRRPAISAWEQAILEAIVMLGDQGTERRIVTRLKSRDRASLTVATLLPALKRLEAKGVIRATSRDDKGESVRVWEAT